MQQPRWLQATVLGLALAGAANLGLAQNTSPTNTFDTASSTTSFVQWWGGGGAGATMTWDPTLDAGGDPNSGSVHYEVNFVGNSGEQFMTFFTIANRWQWDGGYVLDATTYTNLSFDIKVDPSSGQRKNNSDFGPLEIGLVTSGWGTTYMSPTKNIPLSATNWTHISYPLQPSMANIDKVVGFFIKMWSDGAHTNSLIFNIDNFMITKPGGPVIIPDPTVGLKKTGPSGLCVTVDNDTAQWQRDGISTPAGAGPYLWTSQGTYPVTYSCTIADFPTTTKNPGFEAHMYIVNGDTGGTQATGGSPDWGAPDLLILRLENIVPNTNTPTLGSRAQIQWKTNYANANATNIPVAVDVPSVVGTWTVTFTDATHGSLTGPGLTTTNFTLPDDAVANNFTAGTSFIQFGMFKNDGANDGHNNQAHGTFSRVQFTGVASPFDEDFSGPALNTKYEWRKTSTTAVQFIPPGSAWWATWTLPAHVDSYLASKATINGPWIDPGLTNSFQLGTHRQVLVPASALPAVNQGFFALRKRAYTKLQVLVPGETAAPGTPTGKIGTPDEQFAGSPFDVIVNAVDDNWYVIKSATNMVNLSSSDATAAIPADAALVNGTVKFNLLLGTPGNWTFTGKDVTDTTKTSNTSSPVKAN